ncbi:MAG: hypothetical protein P8Y93_05110 [Acidobacteriota bacterium]
MDLLHEPRNLVIALMLLCPTVAVVNSLVFGSKLKQFARRIRMFSSQDDIVRFQRVVAQQMYAALAQIVLLAVPAVLYVLGVVRGFLGVGDLVFVIVPSLVVLAFGIAMKKTEQQVRRIPARDDDLARQRDAVVTTWMRKPFPDW